MSTVLNIVEYATVSVIEGGRVVEIAEEPPLFTQNITIQSSALLSAAFQAKTRIVRLKAGAACSVLFGTSTAVAAATDGRLDQGDIEFRGVPRGGVITNLSVIASA